MREQSSASLVLALATGILVCIWSAFAVSSATRGPTTADLSPHIEMQGLRAEPRTPPVVDHTLEGSLDLRPEALDDVRAAEADHFQIRDTRRSAD